MQLYILLETVPLIRERHVGEQRHTPLRIKKEVTGSFRRSDVYRSISIKEPKQALPNALH